MGRREVVQIKPPRGAILNKVLPSVRGLVQFLAFNDLAGTHVTDYSGNRNHATLVSTVWAGPSVNFPGGEQYLSLGVSNTLDLTDQITVVTRIRVDAAGLPAQFSLIIGKWADNIPQRSFFMGMQDDNTFRFEVRSPTTGFNAGTWVAGQWTNIAFTYNSDDSTLVIYQDETQAGTTSGATGTLDSFPNLEIRMGQSEWGNWEYRGLVEYVRIYNRVLTLNEVNAIHADPWGEFVLPHIPQSIQTRTPIVAAVTEIILTILSSTHEHISSISSLNIFKRIIGKIFTAANQSYIKISKKKRFIR